MNQGKMLLSHSFFFGVATPWTLRHSSVIYSMLLDLSPRRFVDNMAENDNVVDGGIACGDALSWKNRKCNIALITGITGQVSTFIDFSCHNRYCNL